MLDPGHGGDGRGDNGDEVSDDGCVDVDGDDERCGFLVDDGLTALTLR